MSHTRMMKCGKTILLTFVVVLSISVLQGFSLVPQQRGEPAGVDQLMYHRNRQRTGWNDRETILTPQTVSSPAFGLLWESAPLDSYQPPDVAPAGAAGGRAGGGRGSEGAAAPAQAAGRGAPQVPTERQARLFASPLYVHAVEMTQGPLAGRTVSAVYAVTATGYAYAINAAQVGATAPGALLWKRRLAEEPCNTGQYGNLASPIIDLARHRLYVTDCTGQGAAGVWRAHALDMRSGEELQGWPVAIDAKAVDAPGVHKNGSARKWATGGGRRPQRGALNLSLDSSRLYLTFGEPGGWIVSVDTDKARVASAFSSTSLDAELVMGGMWASGGPAIDDQGYIYVSTGTSGRAGNMALVFEDSPGNWGQSILQLREDPVRGFELVGTYTPFNYCITAAWDIDVSSSGAVAIDLDPRTTSTPRLLALGGMKQGNVYLMNRAPMPGSVTKRPPCSKDSESDLSLLAPDIQPQFGKRGPINLFGPYSEDKGYVDQARSRSTLAYFRDAAGGSYVFVTGAAKTGPELKQSAPPGLARLQVVTAPGKPAYLRVTHLEKTQTLYNAGSPAVTSNGGRGAIVWVLDTNGERTASLYGPNAPLAMLYAFDATNLKLLWKTAPRQLGTTGKYNEPTVVNGVAYVGTDRIQAFGLRPQTAR